MVKIYISKLRRVPGKYVPNILSSKDKKIQISSILKGVNRPKLKSYKSKRSRFVVKFENKYNRKITDIKWISKNILKKEGINKILNKGRAAYYSSGSRPNQTKDSWAYARLASVLVGGPASKKRIDGGILEKFKI